MTTALKKSKNHSTGYKLSNLSDLIKSKEFYKLDVYFQDLFKDIYNYSSKLETFTVNSGFEIKKMIQMNENLVKVQKFKEQMLAKTIEENRIIKQELEELRSGKGPKDPSYKSNNYYHLIKSSKRRHKSHGGKLGILHTAANSNKKSRLSRREPSIRQSIDLQTRKNSSVIKEEETYSRSKQSKRSVISNKKYLLPSANKLMPRVSVNLPNAHQP